MRETSRVVPLVALLSLAACADESVSEPGRQLTPPEWGIGHPDRMDVGVVPPVMDHGHPIGADDLVLVAEGQNDVRGLTAGGGLVYWASSTGAASRIVLVQADNGNSEIHDLGGVTPYGALAFDGDHFWFADPYENKVMWVTRGVPGAEKYAESLGVPMTVAATDSHLYWATVEGDIVSAPKDTRLSGVLLKAPAGPAALIADEDRLYWSTESAGALLWSSLDGGPHQAYSADGAYTTQLVQDATRLYWLSTDKQAVQSVTKAGGLVNNLAENQIGLNGIAVDRFFVYFTTTESGAVKRVNKDGSGLVTLATGIALPGAIAVDDEFVYVARTDDGTLLKFAKP